MKILIMGLPGSGKTHFAERMQKRFNCAWYNADKVREMANDWDFSLEGRTRQANRMRTFSEFESSNGRIAIADFICPTPEARHNFSADYIIWMDTISEGRFEDTNKMFVPPETFNVRITELLSDEKINEVLDGIEKEIIH